jgi:ssDNA-binding Zn-finger/Zn-ribbon topoisomerase 1
MTRFMYDKGVKCHVCGKHMDSSESYSIRFDRKETKPRCPDCDRDLDAERRREDEKIEVGENDGLRS